MYEEFYAIDRKIKRKREYITELRARAMSMTMSLGDRVQTTADDRLCNIMCKIVTAEDELAEMYADLNVRKKAAYDEIKRLENEDWQDIVYLHYIELMPMDEIAKIKNKSLGSTYMKNNRAIKRLKKLLT